ncbi:hypothetical protein Cgig2_010617 [Carnegiea gigantea]|uniref:Beta-galactosidase beta-sandwich domain-containing protein n=1 Tax=Carnegiea gigantea TaxID=171969 RepID=A0A9Q1GX99_9CARY|nr:hypothetical protein Cgig2_010617 [Carnegiea gigantea]
MMAFFKASHVISSLTSYLSCSWLVFCIFKVILICLKVLQLCCVATILLILSQYSFLSAFGINPSIHFGSHIKIVMQANVYTDSSGIFAGFISNAGNKTSAVVESRNEMYHLLALSVSILLDCKNVVYNTTKGVQSSGQFDFDFLESVNHPQEIKP